MDGFYDFMSAALPWISMGVLLAIVCAWEAGRKKNVEQERKRR